MRKLTLASIAATLSLALLPALSLAGTNMISTNNVTGTSGWFSTGVWKTNDGNNVPTGAAVTGVFPGNSYKLVQGPNAAIGNNTATTRTRNLYTNGTPVNLWTFPGDSLELTTNTSIRFKRIASPSTVETVNFPGVGGNPGLIMSGGLLNVGDDNLAQPVDGFMEAAAGTQSYLCPGANDGASVSAGRALNILARIQGSGNLVLFMAGTTTANRVSGNNTNYSGSWIVKAGWLLAEGVNSLGTNSNITLDPAFVLPVPPFNAANPVVEVTGPAILEANYDVNSAGVLTLTNGGQMRLHQNCAFTAVLISSTTLGGTTNLSPGTHFFTELRANYPEVFPAGGSGAITVQPFGPLPSLGPTFTTQPLPQMLYAGRAAHFSVAATANGGPFVTYQWRRGGLNLSDGGNISGSTTNALTVSNVSAPDAVNYDVIAYNGVGYATSSVAAITIVPLSGEAYEAAVMAANPVAFYQLNESGDPATNNTTAWDYSGGYNGTYGTAVQNGNPLYNIAGPLTGDGFPGFAGGNTAAQHANANAAAQTTLTPWNLNTNAVTLTAWIKPSGPQGPYYGLVFCRGSGTVAGLGYGGYAVGGYQTLAYHWNDEWETRNWNTGLVPPDSIWSLVALVITPSNATIHVMNTNGLVSASQAHNHILQSFGGPTRIGDDSAGANGARVFNGVIDDVAVFNRALTTAELVTLFTTASGVSSYAPIVASQPASLNLYAGQTAQFTVAAGGSAPLSYQWQRGAIGSGLYADLTDGGKVSGATSPTLSITSISDPPDAADYIVIVSNTVGVVTSAVATLTIYPTIAPEHITLAVQQAGGLDWNTTGNWSDGLAASESAAQKPGSTYEVLAGARLRSPEGPSVATFPGQVLTVSGDGVWNVNPGAGATIGEIRFKQPTYGTVQGTVIFPKLVLNGGQLDAGNANILVIGGRIEVTNKAPAGGVFNNDNSGDRGFRIEARLTGDGLIEYHGYNQTTYQPNYVNSLNIAGTNNTFSGPWNVVMGVLLGTQPNCLGTNTLVVGTNGVLETTYDIDNPGGSLVLNGKMFLHQNDRFGSLIIANIPVSPGVYSAAYLVTNFPANFPSNWVAKTGSTYSNASGSITVLGTAPPTFTVQPLSRIAYEWQTVKFYAVAVGDPPLSYQWKAGAVGSGSYTNLSDGGRFSGVTTTNLTLGPLTLDDTADYVLLASNLAGTRLSSPATLTVNPTNPAENITLSIRQPQGHDWDWPIASDWSDGLTASLSSAMKPGSTYEILPDARLRTPSNTVNAVFPGVRLTVDGDGTFVNDGSVTIGEIRFKHPNPATCYFPRLVMNGGQLDQGDNGLLTIGGRMDILANTPLYADPGAGQDRPWQIDAWLTGNGSIEYHAFNNSFTGNLNITGTTNTFSGKWNIVQGVLLGSGTNSLGTNDITIEANAALETLYDVNNPRGSLVLNGQMFLHQNDTFRAVTVNGVPLAIGTHTFAQLNAAYPANFPASWPQQIGSTYSAGSGSLTVLEGPVQVKIKLSGSNLELTWAQGTLLEATNVTGPWTTNTAPSPYTFAPTEPRKFFKVQVP